MRLASTLLLISAGLSSCAPTQIPTPDELVGFWYHEGINDSNDGEEANTPDRAIHFHENEGRYGFTLYYEMPVGEPLQTHFSGSYTVEEDYLSLTGKLDPVFGGALVEEETANAQFDRFDGERMTISATSAAFTHLFGEGKLEFERVDALP